LPRHTLDHHSPIWWGNLFLLVIETTMFGILFAAYFYLRQNFLVWPPPQTDELGVNYHTQPYLGVATANLGLILLSCVPMWIADRAALKRNRPLVDAGMLATVLFGLVTIYLRWKEFGDLRIKWDDNAYGSIAWMILGMHFAHLIVGTLENGIMTAWLLTHGLDDQHARDVRVVAVYWYWIAVIWIPLYLLVYFGPRLL
ncbi:MAG: heme-copper oxidase subunit III, partial [Burkholderia sp.]|nr:heme-copper oxidase subunit III [Burkholderia sp.]